jgi:pilus assembly protein CpaC
MVQMQVRLVEVRRDQLSKLGLRWDQDAAGPSVSARAGGGSGGLSVSAAFSSELASRIDLLQQQGMAYTLAEPVLSCRSGGVARFVAGGEIPLPVTDGLGSTDIQFKEYGMILEVRPRADSTGAVQAEIQIELSQIDTSVSAGDYPGFLKRQTSTAINAMEGETVAIAGMTLLERGRDRAGVPGLSAIPGLGSLFRTTRRLHRETELLVLITPRIHKGGVIGPGDDSGQQQLFERASGLQQEGELQ